MLCVSCGDTHKDAAEVTVAGALGEAQALGSTHQNFWSKFSCCTYGEDSPQHAEYCHWLPLEIEIIVFPVPGNNDNLKPANTMLIISSRSLVGEFPIASSVGASSGDATLHLQGKMNSADALSSTSSADDMFAPLKDDPDLCRVRADQLLCIY
jgi:hypothetical protein